MDTLVCQGTRVEPFLGRVPPHLCLVPEGDVVDIDEDFGLARRSPCRAHVRSYGGPLAGCRKGGRQLSPRSVPPEAPAVHVHGRFGVLGEGVGVALLNVVRTEREVFDDHSQRQVEGGWWCGDAQVQGVEAQTDDRGSEPVLPVADNGGEAGGVVVVVERAGPADRCQRVCAVDRGDQREAGLAGGEQVTYWSAKCSTDPCRSRLDVRPGHRTPIGSR